MKNAQGYVHIRSHGPKGGATAGWFRDPEADQIVVFYARCSHNDMYNKKVGRELVEQRLAEYLSKTVEERKAFQPSPTMYKIEMQIVRDQMKKFLEDAFEESAIDRMLEHVNAATLKNADIIRGCEGYIEHIDF